MSTLKTQQCEACRADSPLVSDQDRKELHPQVPDWMLVEEDGIEKQIGRAHV